MKKRIIAFLLVAVAVLGIFCSCSEKHDDYVLKVGALNGPTGMGMAKMISEKEKDGIADYTLYGAADEVRAALLTGELDVAAVPANLASVIYNKTEGKYLIAAINTLGVLYIVENGNTVGSLADLDGKTVYATGQGSTPEYILSHLLAAANVTPAEIIYKTEHSELAALLASGQADIAILPQPFVTSVMMKNENIRVAVDMTAEWKKNCEGETVQGVVMVSKDAVENHRELVNQFLDKYKASVDFVNANVDEASEIIAQLGIVGSAAIAKKALPSCNIVFIDGEQMKTALNAFLKVLFDASAASVGGKLPDDKIYYTR